MALLMSRRFRALVLGAAPGLEATAMRLEANDLQSARELSLTLAEALGEGRPAPGAAQLYTLALLDEARRAILAASDLPGGRSAAGRILTSLDRILGRAAVTKALVHFARYFDVLPADRAGSPTAGANELEEESREALLVDLIAFWAAQETARSSASTMEVLLDQTWLEDEAVGELVQAFEALAESEPSPVRGEENLLQTLRLSTAGSAGSLAQELDHALSVWRPLPDEQVHRLRIARGALAEESAPRFGPGPGSAEVPHFDPLEAGVAAYSEDDSWMRDLVLQAKNALVWLEQLSSRHKRRIEALDEIPDAELALLARQGVTGLWLIGIWDRSPASRQIKQLCGNPSAAASAYSIRRYRISESLGGEAALEELSRRAQKYGIRLAADLIPNHLGIDSEWVLRYPERFIGQDHCPFPGYTFTGPDLSADPEVGIYIEDHYFDQSDAAVVFKRLNRRTGSVRYIYHGNDGTSTPWNDTAQLDFRRADVREAVIDEILEVARRVPVLRFDAAMTLARRHFQRLWFPAPGEEGAIPSRAEHGMSRDDFQAEMPEEFWRLVVDRIQEVAPGTLLLAEAFWLMEGYFVRTLGMHRVYNSAFMHMLRHGRNSDFRKLLRETLDFDARILSRYVNFMSNPDEESAREQFGDGDRYFGVATLMATLPGLPLLSHGQVEGLRERYGMEFEKPLLDEEPEAALMRRHEEQIAPLLLRRTLFSGVESFRLLVALDDRGAANDDVIVYSHGSGAEAMIVAFNNNPDPWAGRIVSPRPSDGELPAGLEFLVDPAVSDAEEIEALGSGAEGISLPAGELRARGLPLLLKGFESLVLEEFRPAGGSGSGLDPSLDLAVKKLHRLHDLDEILTIPTTGRARRMQELVGAELDEGGRLWIALLAMLIGQAPGGATEGSAAVEWDRLRHEALQLPGEAAGPVFSAHGIESARARGWLEARAAPGGVELEDLLDAWEDLEKWVAASRGEEERTWLAEEFEDLLVWRGALAALSWLPAEEATELSLQRASEAVAGWFEALIRVGEAAEECGLDCRRVRDRFTRERSHARRPSTTTEPT